MSYATSQRTSSESLSWTLKIGWPLILALVYGVLITIGVEPPVISAMELWSAAILLSVACWAWASILWLHEQGIADDSVEPKSPEGPPKALVDIAVELPKLAPVPGE